MTDSTLYSDRVGHGRPCVSEIITTEAWAGITVLIQRQIAGGSLARAYPRYDHRGNIKTGTDEEAFLRALKAFVPGLTESDDASFGQPSRRVRPHALIQALLNPEKAPDTVTALDVVEFVALHTDHFLDAQQTNLQFNDSLAQGQTQFQRDINLLFARNGIAFAIGDDMRVRRIGPPEARPLVSDFNPHTGDLKLDDKLNDAVARFLSRNPLDRRDALEKLWDAFERLKTLELGGDKKKASTKQLLLHTVPDSEPFRELLEEEFRTLTGIGNNFTIRHHEHDKHDIPDGPAVDYLFVRLASLISLVLQNTGRMNTQ